MPHTATPMRSIARPLAALGLCLSLSACASGFVSGGVSTASVSNGRVDIDSRVGSAEVGPAGPRASARRSAQSVCVDEQTGAVFQC